MPSSKAPKPIGPYPHSRRVGNILFLSGVGPRKQGSNVIPGVVIDGQGNIVAHDIEKQCHAVFQNVKIILEEAGSNWNNLIDITVFLTDMKGDFDRYNQIYADYFKNDQPCRTTVEVKSLPTPIAIELKCIAIID